MLTFWGLRSNMGANPLPLTPEQQYLKAKGDRTLFFDYTASKKFCDEIGLKWLGDDFLAQPDKDAWLNGFTQTQVDIAMRHHLWMVKHLFSPSSYRWWQRILLALFFLLKWKL